jgi:uncharacterized membrane protein
VSPIGCLALASAAFVGTHFLLSHPLRASVVARLGEKGFALLYTVIALATLFAMWWTYGAAAFVAPAPLWDAGQAGWIAATLLMWLGAILFVGSLRRNPAFPRPGRLVQSIERARGVFAITRHPMNWGFAIWALVHIIANPTLASLIVSAAILILAIGGSVGQDIKKERALGEVWREWQARTSFVPFGRGLAWPDVFAFVGGTALWLAATFAHGALGYRPAGVWAFFA